MVRIGLYMLYPLLVKELAERGLINESPGGCGTRKILHCSKAVETSVAQWGTLMYYLFIERSVSD